MNRSLVSRRKLSAISGKLLFAVAERLLAQKAMLYICCSSRVLVQGALHYENVRSVRDDAQSPMIKQASIRIENIHLLKRCKSGSTLYNSVINSISV